MKKTKRFYKKILALTLSAVLMITTLVFFDAGALISRAAEQIVTNVHFIVPEIIYLKPDINSKTSSTIGEFQWYVGSTVNTATFEETLSTGENPTGSVYFEYTAASSVDISFKFIDDNLNDYTSLPEQSGIVINGTRILPQGNSSQNNTIHSIGSNFNGQILSGYSPALNPYEKGCYIEWTASFTDSTDGIDKSVKAYTYVYKPYIQQAGVALRSVNGTSSRRLYAQNTAWISGINGLLEAGNYCPNPSGFVVFSSSYNSAKLADQKYIQLPTCFNDNYNNDSIRNLILEKSWLSETSSFVFPDESIAFSDYENTSSSKSNVYNMETAPLSEIFVDSSRYTNLIQIPNLTVGMMVTDDENSTKGAWFAADDTNISEEITRTGCSSNFGESQLLWERHNEIYASSQGTITNPYEHDSLEGVKYNRGWNKSIEAGNSSKVFKFKFGYYNEGKGIAFASGDPTIVNICVLPLKVNAVDKGSLRAKLNEASKAFAYLGICEDGSSIYNYLPDDVFGFMTAYKTAYTVLTAIDSSAEAVNEAITTLNGAYLKLINANRFDVSTIEAGISIYQNLSASNYTSPSWNNLLNTVDAVYSADVFGHRVRKSVVAELADNLFDAINSLVLSEADYTQLLNVIAQAEACEKDNYTTESWTNLINALEYAKSVDMNLTVEDQAIIDSAAADLLDALCALVPVSESDLSGLNEIISYAQNLNESLYTDYTWACLSNTLDTASDYINGTEIYEQDYINQLISSIRSAINGLAYKPADYSQLNAASAAAAALDSVLYTEESWQELQAALNAAVYGLDITHQSEVDAMAAAVIEAANNLVLIPQGCTEHVWGDWCMITNPTTTSTGLIRRYCANCDEYETIVVPMLNPTFVTGVNLSAKSIALSLGDNVILAADITPETAENKNIIWSSTDENVVTVTQNGRIAAVGVGVANIIVKSQENPGIMDYCMVRVASLVTCNTTSVVDNESGFVYGLSANLTSLDGYIDLVDESTSVFIESQSIGTGTEINIIRDDEVLDTYTAVIFGDTTGDSWYDGQDAMIVNCLANGMLSREDVGEAVYMASDCNHDGVIDQLDVDILNQAGVLLASVDQSKSKEELLETSSAYVEYLNLIDQTVETESNTSTETTVDNTPAEADKEPAQVNWFQMILSFFSALLQFVYSLFTL